MAEPRRKAAAAEETSNNAPQIELGLNAAIVTVREQQPHILVVRPVGTAGTDAWDALPFGPFAPRAHRTLEIGLRAIEVAFRADFAREQELLALELLLRQVDGRASIVDVGFEIMARESA